MDGTKETSQAGLSKRSKQEPFSLQRKWLLGRTQLCLWLSPSVYMRGSACPLVQEAPRRPNASPCFSVTLPTPNFLLPDSYCV